MPRPLASALPVIAGLVLSAAPVDAVPLEDTGFVPATPLPDPDLVVVRERAYGADGVDLTAYGLGTPDFVQSIYFRFFVDRNSSTVDSFTGRVRFPAGVTVLGIITDGAALGGATDDGVLTDSDLIFGVAADPDDYSESARGFECCGGVATSEYVCVHGDDSVIYGLNINSGMDDFRVIIDYGDSFPEGLAFDVDAYEVSFLGGAVPSDGIRVGDPSSTVPGAGDFGEIKGLHGIPLTTTEEPNAVPSLPFDPIENLFVIRDAGSSSLVDAYDPRTGLPAPDRYRSFDIDNPAGITDGPGGLIYAVGANGGFAVMVPDSDSTRGAIVSDLPGNTRDVTNVPGLPDLFQVRDATSYTFVDRFDPVSETYTGVDSIPASLLGTPIAIADAADGRLWSLGTGTGFVAVDPVLGGYEDHTLAVDAAGSYVDLTGVDLDARLYLLRDAGSEGIVDVFLIDSDSLVVDHVRLPSVPTPVAITDGPGGDLFVLGADGAIVRIDGPTGLLLQSTGCFQFSGSYRSLTNLGTAEPTAVPERRTGSIAFPHRAAPVPFRSATRISFRAEVSGSARVEVFSLAGRRVALLLDEQILPGSRDVVWDGRDARGTPVPAGVYFYRIVLGDRAETGRLLRLR